MYSCLRNGHSLLFHNFMDSNSVLIIHLIKLINADYTTISKNHGTSLKPSFPSLLISRHSGSQTNTRRTSTSCRDGQWGNVHDSS
uniref:Uncharacterized protein n=1 Tax=Arundo donax TaxID=35708 RepID=A0A0A9CR90_ARUDO